MDTSLTKKSTSINFGFMTWPGVVLSIAIIAIRAFQPGAVLMQDWSLMSWVLMLLPAFLPIVVWLLLLAATTIGALATNTRW